MSVGGNARVAIFAFLFLLCCLAGGGASRANVLSLLYLRPVAILVACYCLHRMSGAQLRTIAAPLAMLAGYAAVMLAQLTPVPGPLWATMPGHASFAMLVQAEPGWRPPSISPDLTLNSLVSLSLPLAALLLMSLLTFANARIALALVASALVSGCVAVMQLAFGAGSAFYLYRQTADSAVGLFANPNHQAVFLACMLPVIALLLAQRARTDPRRDAIGAGVAIFILVLIVVTGSRSGLVAGGLGLVGAFALHQLQFTSTRQHERRRYRLFYLAFLGGALILLALMTMLGRDLAIDRFLNLNVSKDLRVADFGLFIDLARAYFPFGSGAGTFDPAFRIIEPASIVKKTFVNHAHNELIELVITAGLPGLILLVVFLGWYLAAIWSVVRAPRSDVRGYAVLGGCQIAIMLLASLSDYLLRTPLMAAFFAMACGWLSVGAKTVKQTARSRALDLESRSLPNFQDDAVP